MLFGGLGKYFELPCEALTSIQLPQGLMSVLNDSYVCVPNCVSNKVNLCDLV